MYMAKKTEAKPKTPREISNSNLKRDAGPGRPKGQRNYATIYKEGLSKLAQMNGIKPSELEEKIMQKAIKKALDGDFGFYTDMMNRLHGKAQSNVDHTTKGESIQGNIITFKDYGSGNK